MFVVLLHAGAMRVVWGWCGGPSYTNHRERRKIHKLQTYALCVWSISRSLSLWGNVNERSFSLIYRSGVATGVRSSCCPSTLSLLQCVGGCRVFYHVLERAHSSVCTHNTSYRIEQKTPSTFLHGKKYISFETYNKISRKK